MTLMMGRGGCILMTENTGNCLSLPAVQTMKTAKTGLEKDAGLGVHICC